MLGQNNWKFVFSAVRRGGYSSAQIAEVLQVPHVIAAELVYRSYRVIHQRQPKKVRSLASRKLAYMDEE